MDGRTSGRTDRRTWIDLWMDGYWIDRLINKWLLTMCIGLVDIGVVAVDHQTTNNLVRRGERCKI